SHSEACGEVHIPMPLISVLEIGRLQAALDDAASCWSHQYAHDPAFKRLLDTWAQGFVQLGQDIEHGRLTLDAMLERSQLLGTLLARAVKMADAGGWTTSTREYMFDLGSVYGEASIIQNDWNMAPVL